MTKFVIRNNSKTSGQPLYWTGNYSDPIVGICRANEALLFETQAEAEQALELSAIKGKKFYDLVVAKADWVGMGLPHPNFGQNGWMVRHPGYDSVH